MYAKNPRYKNVKIKKLKKIYSNIQFFHHTNKIANTLYTHITKVKTEIGGKNIYI